MGVQAQNATLVANSAGSINTILNSLLTSNVRWQAYAMAGYSYNAVISEATDPTRSAIFLSVVAQGISAAIANFNLPTRLYLFQRDE